MPLDISTFQLVVICGFLLLVIKDFHIMLTLVMLIHGTLNDDDATRMTAVLQPGRLISSMRMHIGLGMAIG